MSEHQRPAIAVMNTLLTEMVAPLAEAFDLRFPGCETQGLDDAVIAIVNIGTDLVSAETMDRYPRLRLIASPSAGIDGVDLDAAAARSIAVTSGAGINASDVAAHAVGLTLAARGDLFAGDAFVRTGAWQASRPQPRRSVAADNVGIVGLGAIGRRVAESLGPLCEAVAWFGPRPMDAPWPRMPSLKDLAEWADILLLCARGGSDTHGMIGAAEFAAIGPDGLFVNVARGYMVDEQALRAALITGALGGAALDVFEREPCPPELWQDVRNCMLSPHSGGSTSRTAELAGKLVRANLQALLSGAPLRNQVMPDRGCAPAPGQQARASAGIYIARKGPEMLDARDHADIRNLLNLYPHIIDEPANYGRLGEFFTDDAVFSFGPLGSLEGIEALTAYFCHSPKRAELIAQNKLLAHNVANIHISEPVDGLVRTRSRCLGVSTEGLCSVVVYDDELRKTASGWRIARRMLSTMTPPTVTPRG